jgi:hypothetical protein
MRGLSSMQAHLSTKKADFSLVDPLETKASARSAPRAMRRQCVPLTLHGSYRKILPVPRGACEAKP